MPVSFWTVVVARQWVVILENKSTWTVRATSERHLCTRAITVRVEVVEILRTIKWQFSTRAGPVGRWHEHEVISFLSISLVEICVPVLQTCSSFPEVKHIHSVAFQILGGWSQTTCSLFRKRSWKIITAARPERSDLLLYENYFKKL